MSLTNASKQPLGSIVRTAGTPPSMAEKSLGSIRNGATARARQRNTSEEDLAQAVLALQCILLHKREMGRHKVPLLLAQITRVRLSADPASMGEIHPAICKVHATL